MDETSIITAITALWGQVVNSPACLLVIVGLNIVAYVLDIWPSFPSRWIPIIVILTGPVAYPFFASRGSVPPEYPHPAAVLVVNGLIAGMAALLVHKQLVQRFLLPKPEASTESKGAASVAATETRQASATTPQAEPKTTETKTP